MVGECVSVTTMVPLFAAAVALASPPPNVHPVSATAQATATIRVIKAVVLKLDGSANADAPTARDSLVRATDDTTQAVKLIEFQ